MRPCRAWISILLISLLLLAGCSQNLDNLDFDVDVQVEGDTATVTVTLKGIKDNGQVHAHLFLDGGPELMMYAPTYTYRNLQPGEHELVVELAGADHLPLPGQRKTVTFVIEGDGS